MFSRHINIHGVYKLYGGFLVPANLRSSIFVLVTGSRGTVSVCPRTPCAVVDTTGGTLEKEKKDNEIWEMLVAKMMAFLVEIMLRACCTVVKRLLRRAIGMFSAR